MSCSCGYLERALQGNWENQGGNKLASIQAVEKLADRFLSIRSLSSGGVKLRESNKFRFECRTLRHKEPNDAGLWQGKI